MTTIAVTDGVSLRLGPRVVVCDVSMSIDAGEVVALVGPNGAGKSSLLRLLAGLASPTTGRVSLEGAPLAARTAGEVATIVAYLPQARAVHWPMPVRAIVGLGRLPHQARGSTPADDNRAIDTAMAEMDIVALAARPVLALSGGEQARVLLARALAQEPKLLIADEPTAGLDPGHQLALMDVLCRRAAAGSAAIVALHDLGLAARYADRVILLDGGRLVAAGPPAEVLSHVNIARTYGVDMLVTTVDGVPVFAPRAPVAGTTGPAATV